MAKSKTVANLAVAVTARTQSFVKGMKRVRKEMRGVTNAVTKLSTRGLVGLSTALVTGVGISQKMIDTQAKQARSLKIMQSEYAGLAHAFSLAGISQQRLFLGMSALAKNTVDATRGIGTAKDAFEDMNIDVQELVKLDPAQQMYVLADALREVKNSSQRVNFSRAIFGRSGTEMLNALAGGSAELKKYVDEAVKLGIATDAVSGAKIEEANDQMLRMARITQGVFNTIAVELAPMISEVAQRFIDWGTEGEGAAEKTRNIIRDDVVPAIGFLVESWGFVKGAVDLASGAVLQFGATLLKVASYSPAGLIVRGVDKLTEAITGESAVGLGELIENLEGAAGDLFERGTAKINDDATGRFQKMFDEIQEAADKRARDAVAAGGVGDTGEPIKLGTPKRGQFAESSMAQVIAAGLSSVSDPTTEEVKKSNQYLERIARSVEGGMVAKAV